MNLKPAIRGLLKNPFVMGVAILSLAPGIGANAAIVVQLLVESRLIAALGGIAGLIVAWWTLGLIASLVPGEFTLLKYEVDFPILLFTAALTFATGILFGLFPALHSTRHDLITVLKGQSGQPSGARSAARFRTTLATTQIALSMGLLILAGLFTKSLFNVSRAKLGLNAENGINLLSGRDFTPGPSAFMSASQRIPNNY